MTAEPATGSRPSPSLVARGAAALLVGYKRWISPLLPPSCLYSPTCSEYARLAILEHGFWRGLPLAVRRLASCHPLGPGGIDLP